MQKLQLLLILIALAGMWSCTYEVLPAVNNCEGAPQLKLLATQETQCGSSTGEIIVEADSVAGTPIKFSINGESENVSGSFQNLTAGTYQVSLTTLEGCINTLAVEIKNQSGFNVAVQLKEADCGTNNGQVTITPEGGQPPYQYKLNSGNFQSEPIFNGLVEGEYTIIAEDATGCSVSQSAKIAASINFSTIRTIIQTNCVNGSCHGGNVSPDFRENNNIANNAARIKSRTQSKSMPPASSGKSLSTQEIEKIACWVDSGANQ